MGEGGLLREDVGHGILFAHANLAGERHVKGGQIAVLYGEGDLAVLDGDVGQFFADFFTEGFAIQVFQSSLVQRQHDVFGIAGDTLKQFLGQHRDILVETADLFHKIFFGGGDLVALAQHGHIQILAVVVVAAGHLGLAVRHLNDRFAVHANFLAVVGKD